MADILLDNKDKLTLRKLRIILIHLFIVSLSASTFQMKQSYLRGIEIISLAYKQQ